MKALRIGFSVALAGATLPWLFATAALACSPPFEEPTIRALGPAQVVVVGTIGERVQEGRLFHVKRSYNGGVTASRIVIAFKEGEPVGDCSYTVRTGAALIIAPYREPDGRLSADLSTLQADPASDAGRKYIAEATALFGPGVVPVTDSFPADSPTADDPTRTADVRLLIALLVVGVALLFAVVALIGRRRQRDDSGKA